MPDSRPPRSPWHVRRIPLEGREVAEWFRLRGWSVTDADLAASHAFIDEAIVADVAIRRVWHTALTLSRPATQEPERDTLVVHVAGTGRVQVGDAAPTALAPNDVLFIPRRVAVTYRSDEPIARIEIGHGSRDRAGDLFHTHGELVSAVMITSAVNALFHAHDSRGGGGGVMSAAQAVAASLQALIAAVRAEALARSGPRIPRHPADEDYDRLYERARTILEAEAARRDLTIDAVALRLGTGRRRLERAFRVHGQSPGDVLRAHRLRLARALVDSERGLGLAEIAEMSGFPSGRALRDAFARHGVTVPHLSGGVRSHRRRA